MAVSPIAARASSSVGMGLYPPSSSQYGLCKRGSAQFYPAGLSYNRGSKEMLQPRSDQSCISSL